MQAGSLTSRITIQRRAGGVDEWGTPLPESWEDVAQVWASIRHMNGSEAIRAGAVASTVQASIRIRRRSGLDAGMRVLHKGTTYQIKAVLPDEQSREHVDLVCEVVT